MTGSKQDESIRDRLVFYPVAVMGGVFCITVFLAVAATFGDPAHPLHDLINRFGTPVLLIEAGLLVVVGLLAMTVDRVLTLRRRSQNSPAQGGTEETASGSSEAGHVD